MRRSAFFAAATTVLSLISVCRAGSIMGAQETVADFGMVGQQSDGIVNGGEACGPTSAYNSFVYLQNTWGITGLLQATPAATINQLGSYMGYGDNTHPGTPDTGVSADQFVDGKTQYLGAQTLNQAIGVSSVTGTDSVTWEFILHELQQKEDVELGFTWTTGGGHIV